MSEFLSARDIVKDYGDVRRGGLRVLHGVSLHARQGEFVIIVGASGAGKSTLLHILGLLDAPTAGSVWLEGRDLGALDQRQQARIRAREFGFVFQFFHLLPDFTALENVILPAMTDTGLISWRRRRAEVVARGRELLARVGLADRLEHRPAELSGGERQRVAIARALINRPRLLLLDEPTGNLDTRTGDSVFELIWELNQKEGQTTIMVTHNEALVRRATGARILRIRDGRFV